MAESRTLVGVLSNSPTIRYQVYEILTVRPMLPPEVHTRVKVACEAFLRTAEGRAYLESADIDRINWGDALVALPDAHLEAVGILSFKRMQVLNVMAEEILGGR